ncbi:sugar 3,4-ketoisomerase [Algoriphagus namhaensis]|uniref:Sugar 3,4-ketoisomerase n=1 Tax=Algoriphagus namhaensis TaxID=915353 RepID=A0ABV8ARX3_9BACT
MLTDEQHASIKLGIPFLFKLKGVNQSTGNLSYWENNEIFPDGIQRCFWVYDVEPRESRGNHAHFSESQVIVAMNGQIHVKVENVLGEEFFFELDHPSVGLFLPPKNWITTRFEPGSVLLGMCNETFKESDYIRDFELFKSLSK